MENQEVFNALRQHVLEEDVPALSRLVATLTHKQRQEVLAGEDGHGRTLLDGAVEMESWDTATWLIEKGARVVPSVSRLVWGRVAYALWPGIAKNSFSAETAAQAQVWADRLIAAGVGKTDLTGVCWGAAHLATAGAGNETPRAVAFLGALCKAGYGIDDIDEMGETPLLVALWHQDRVLTQWLVANGASLDAKTRGGSDALSMLVREDPRSGEAPSAMIERVASCLGVLAEAGMDVRQRIEVFAATLPWRAPQHHPEQTAILHHALALLEGQCLQEILPQAGSSSRPGRL